MGIKKRLSYSQARIVQVLLLHEKLCGQIPTVQYPKYRLAAKTNYIIRVYSHTSGCVKLFLGIAVLQNLDQMMAQC